MIRAVIFDMFETLITHYRSPLYFGTQMAQDAGIDPALFLAMWRPTEHARSIGVRTLESVLEEILRAGGRWDPDGSSLVRTITQKRIETKRDCFRRLHDGILPMMEELQARGLGLGLISNCFSEEAPVIRESILAPYFDAACLSWEMGTAKPDPEIFLRCADMLGVSPAECLYVGDGGSHELETASALGMQPVQAMWYLRERGLAGDAGQSGLPWPAAESPEDVLRFAGNRGTADLAEGGGAQRPPRAR